MAFFNVEKPQGAGPGGTALYTTTQHNILEAACLRLYREAAVAAALLSARANRTCHKGKKSRGDGGVLRVSGAGRNEQPIRGCLVTHSWHCWQRRFWRVWAGRGAVQTGVPGACLTNKGYIGLGHPGTGALRLHVTACVSGPARTRDKARVQLSRLSDRGDGLTGEFHSTRCDKICWAPRWVPCPSS